MRRYDDTRWRERIQLPAGMSLSSKPFDVLGLHYQLNKVTIYLRRKIKAKEKSDLKINKNAPKSRKNMMGFMIRLHSIKITDKRENENLAQKSA